MYTVRKKVIISSAHFLPGYKGKCKEVHGHNWKVWVTCQSDRLNSQGMVVDFSEIKKILNKFDHKMINDFLPLGITPTAENLAKYFCDIIPKCIRIEIEENEGSTAIYEKSGE